MMTPGFALAAESPAATPWPSEVKGRFKLTFNGFDVGHLNFKSRVGAQGYALEGDSKVSALFGVFKAQVTAGATGTAADGKPKPAGFTMNYKANSKIGAVKLGFDKGSVTSISVQPPSSSNKPIVPIQPQHLKDALDPFSAVMVLSRAGSAGPCAHTVPVFDGKQRYDLTFSNGRSEPIPQTKKSGAPVMGMACRITYHPVAGHRVGEEPKMLAVTAKMEVLLRPVPSANLWVPARVTISTAWGTAIMTPERIDITTANAGQIALVD